MKPGRVLWLLLILLLLSLVLWVTGTLIGSTGFENLPSVWLGVGATEYPVAYQILFEIRLPRTLGAWAAGALLGLAGALAQGLFRNPLADPYLLGSASGAGLGVALALVFTGMMAGSAGVLGTDTQAWRALLAQLGLTGAAFVGAVLAVLLTLLLAHGASHTLRLLLAGVITGMVLGAVTALVLFFTPELLRPMQAFALGATSFVGWVACFLLLGIWLACLIAACLMARVLDGLRLGEATAASLGLPLAPLRMALIAVLALATGAAVAQTGLIAFVGLVAPHLVRALVKVSYRWLVLLASLMGAVLLAAADQLARWLIAPQELPVGVLTAILGGTYLLWLMQRRSSTFGR